MSHSHLKVVGRQNSTKSFLIVSTLQGKYRWFSKEIPKKRVLKELHRTPTIKHDELHTKQFRLAAGRRAHSKSLQISCDSHNGITS